jgi:periplasmic protein CpxP/Spy
MMKRMLRVAVLALVLSGAAAHAQAVTAQPKENRPALEQQFRERTAKLVQQRLGLNDVQLGKLEQTNARFAPQLRQLAAQERDIRGQLRQEMMPGNSANQQHVSDLLDAALRVQRQRLGIVEAEQKELAGFLTPVQRARYMALQAQFGKRAQELSGQGGRPRPGLGQRRRPIGRLP